MWKRLKHDIPDIWKSPAFADVFKAELGPHGAWTIVSIRDNGEDFDSIAEIRQAAEYVFSAWISLVESKPALFAQQPALGARAAKVAECCRAGLAGLGQVFCCADGCTRAPGTDCCIEAMVAGNSFKPGGRALLPTYNDFDIILDNFSRVSRLHPTPHAVWAVFYLVPSRTSC